MREISNKDVIEAFSNVPPDLVESFGEEGDFIRQHLLNPLLFRLLGNIEGKEILDAGCGQGYLCRKLAKKGAVVTGIEPAGIWFSYAKRKEDAEPLGIQYIQADLSVEVQAFEKYDFVIANMVFMDIPDYFSALSNCVTALKKGGKIIFSLLHPCFEESGSTWADKGFVEVHEYFQQSPVKQSYGYFIHRTISTYINSVLQAGCSIQEVIEPKLTDDIAKQYHAERYAKIPGYIVISATKVSSFLK